MLARTGGRLRRKPGNAPCALRVVHTPRRTLAQASAQESRITRTGKADACPVRLSAAPVVAQMSAQTSFRLMLGVSSRTSSSARQASAQAEHVGAHP